MIYQVLRYNLSRYCIIRDEASLLVGASGPETIHVLTYHQINVFLGSVTLQVYDHFKPRFVNLCSSSCYSFCLIIYLPTMYLPNPPAEESSLYAYGRKQTKN